MYGKPHGSAWKLRPDKTRLADQISAIKGRMKGKNRQKLSENVTHAKQKKSAGA